MTTQERINSHLKREIELEVSRKSKGKTDQELHKERQRKARIKVEILREQAQIKNDFKLDFE